MVFVSASKSTWFSEALDSFPLVEPVLGSAGSEEEVEAVDEQEITRGRASHSSKRGDLFLETGWRGWWGRGQLGWHGAELPAAGV